MAEEDLREKRKAGPFHGRCALIALAEATLRPAWKTGSAADVHAMTNVMAEYMRDLIGHAPYARDQQGKYHAWLKQFVY